LTTFTRAPIAANRRSSVSVNMAFPFWLPGSVCSESAPGRNRAPPSIPANPEIDAVALSSSMSRPAVAERCFPSLSPTLRPWIADRRTAHVRAGRRPTWRSFGARSPHVFGKKAKLKHTLLFKRLFCLRTPSGFLSQAGPRFDSDLVQAGHHLWFRRCLPPLCHEKGDLAVALVWLAMRLEN
jgi:hypothetical protein